MPNIWDWPVAPRQDRHTDRLPLMRAIDFDTTQVVETTDQDTLHEDVGPGRRGKALSLNISEGGMLLLMHWSPQPEQVLRVQVPVAVNQITVPTLAEVRWVRNIPFPSHENLYFVGLKFLF